MDLNATMCLDGNTLKELKIYCFTVLFGLQMILMNLWKMEQMPLFDI